MLKSQKIREPKHLDFIRTLPCVKRGWLPSDPAHIRMFGDAGIGQKPSDDRVVPLHRDTHVEQHSDSELRFWGGEEKTRRAIQLARDLYVYSGQEAECIKLINLARKDIFQ